MRGWRLKLNCRRLGSSIDWVVLCSNPGWAGPSSSCHLILVCVNYNLNGSLRISSRLHARLNNQISHPITETHLDILDNPVNKASFTCWGTLIWFLFTSRCYLNINIMVVYHSKHRYTSSSIQCYQIGKSLQEVVRELNAVPTIICTGLNIVITDLQPESTALIFLCGKHTSERRCPRIPRNSLV